MNNYKIDLSEYPKEIRAWVVNEVQRAGKNYLSSLAFPPMFPAWIRMHAINGGAANMDESTCIPITASEFIRRHCPKDCVSGWIASDPSGGLLNFFYQPVRGVNLVSSCTRSVYIEPKKIPFDIPNTTISVPCNIPKSLLT